MTSLPIVLLSVLAGVFAVAFLAAVSCLVVARQRLADREEEFARTLAERSSACADRIAEKEAACTRLLAEKDRFVGETVRRLEERFGNLAEEKLKASSQGLTDHNARQMAALMGPLHEQLAQFKAAFEANRLQQVANKASFDQAIADLGARALRIGADAENLARALKSESKTQGDWGEMVLSNILAAAGLKEGVDFLPQAQETDADGNRLIPDVEIPLPNREKLLIDSKCSVTAYLDYVAAADEAAKDQAAKAHVVSVRKHLDELAGKDYIRKIKGSQGYILMFIPNEGSYLLAMDRDRKLATDAFRKHVIIVNPTTLLLCLQVVALLRSREAQNENAEKISQAAARMYEKFVGFSDTFADIGRRLEATLDAYRKANGQLCAGNANVVRQLESLKDLGVVTGKTINARLLEEAGREPRAEPT